MSWRARGPLERSQRWNLGRRSQRHALSKGRLYELDQLEGRQLVWPQWRCRHLAGSLRASTIGESEDMEECTVEARVTGTQLTVSCTIDM